MKKKAGKNDIMEVDLPLRFHKYKTSLLKKRYTQKKYSS